MELDEMKQSWKNSNLNNNSKTDIMEMIMHKSKGPLASLKRSFRKEIVFMAFLPFMLILTNSNDLDKVFSSIMFWCYTAFCIGIVIFGYNSYRMVEKMSNMDTMVKSNLEQQITILETRLKWTLVILRYVMIFFIILTEIIPYVQHFRLSDKWHSLSPLIRYSVYIGLLLMQYFVGRRVSKRKYGTHIDHLKELLKDIEN